MNQSKFSLADVLALVTALVFGFVYFLGDNFSEENASSSGIIRAVIIALLLAGTALGAKLLKRTSRHFKTCLVWEIILLVLFAGVAVFHAYPPFAHYFDVSAKKAEIQSQLSESITQAENMFAEYERYAKSRENLYRSKLNGVVALKDINPSKYKEYGFVNNGIDDYKQIEHKVSNLRADLFPSDDESDYEKIKKNSTTWLADARNIVSSWKPIGIVGVVNEIANKSNQWLNELIQFSTKREHGEQADDFAYNLTFEDVKSRFTTHGKPTPLSIFLAVVAYALMLLSWIVTNRHTRFPGWKVIFGIGETNGSIGNGEVNL
jgi:Tfp pilus assembly protein PilE